MTALAASSALLERHAWKVSWVAFALVVYLLIDRF